MKRQRRLQGGCEFGGFSLAPVVEKDVTRLLLRHVVVNGDDIDTRFAQGFEK